MVIAAVTLVGVVVFGVLQALIVAVGLSIVDVLMRSAKPHDAVLGYVPRLGRWANVSVHPRARVTPGVVVYRLDDRLLFANARYVSGRIREAVAGAPSETEFLVFDAEGFLGLDASGVEAFQQLLTALSSSGVTVVVARMKSHLDEAVRRHWADRADRARALLPHRGRSGGLVRRTADRGVSVSSGSEVPSPSTRRTWRARVFVTASDQRLRLPRDLIGAATGAAAATAAWLFVAAGVDARVGVAVPMSISWLVTGVAVCGTTAFTVAAVVLCILARRFSLVGHVVIAAGGAALVAWGVAHWLGRGTPAAPPLIAATFATAFLVIRILGVPWRTPLWVVVVLGALGQVFDAHLVPLRDHRRGGPRNHGRRRGVLRVRNPRRRPHGGGGRLSSSTSSACR